MSPDFFLTKTAGDIHLFDNSSLQHLLNLTFNFFLKMCRHSSWWYTDWVTCDDVPLWLPLEWFQTNLCIPLVTSQSQDLYYMVDRTVEGHHTLEHNHIGTWVLCNGSCTSLALSIFLRIPHSFQLLSVI